MAQLVSYLCSADAAMLNGGMWSTVCRTANPSALADPVVSPHHRRWWSHGLLTPMEDLQYRDGGRSPCRQDMAAAGHQDFGMQSSVWRAPKPATSHIAHTSGSGVAPHITYSMTICMKESNDPTGPGDGRT